MKPLLIGIVAIAASLGTTAQAACPTSRSATTLEGQYAAIDEGSFRSMARALDQQNQARMKALVEEGQVVTLPAGKAACILHRPYHSNRLQIRIEDGGRTYWVTGSSVSIPG